MPRKVTTSTETSNSDEYAVIKNDLLQLAVRGTEDKDEETPARNIRFAIFGFRSAYGMTTQASGGDLPTAQFTYRRKDRKGNEHMPRFHIGMFSEVVTKDVVQKSENIGSRKRVVSEFEALKNAATLLATTIDEAQDKGDKIQRKIDEENYEHWDTVTAKSDFPIKRNIVVESYGKPIEPLSVAKAGEIIGILEQDCEQICGARIDRIDTLVAHYADCQFIASNDGSAVDSTLERFTIILQIKLRSGVTTFGAIRGTGGSLDILTNWGDDYLDALHKLARRVAQDSIDRDRAQGTSILGSECPVVLGSHASGVLAHEVFGHPLESDIICENRRSKSAKVILKQRIGAQVSSHRALNIVDCGNSSIDIGGKVLNNCWGAIYHDERGQYPKKTYLVKNGVQVGVMADERTFNEITSGLSTETAANLIEHGLSGNVRREKYDSPALVRMTNTYIEADPNGPKSIQELAAMCPKNKRGIYISTCAGGWVNTETGDFCVKGALGWLIENGQITDKPIKDVDITGNISKFGDQIKGIGSIETVTDSFAGICGKDSQSVPVLGAGPALYIENAKVGGGSGYSFEETLKEYKRQMEQFKQGKRGEVYLPQLEISEGETNHNNLCMISYCMPLEMELDIIKGTRIRADYERDDDGRMVARCQTM